ncbi:GGDEF domain-containing protein [Butyrivibrio sp. INlla14]|uniref:GGDEF domain-containing protein n=1 Tax=Butyrivibrio sp. INlla14 TaxID=1520808 RepID=UPI000876D14F|nr:GGDEF domain-containing protein [Butyrivibrio sp. INlla14]SCY47075.1 diguanylate cyclase (GGDEF) domain-containing protein [Butyrivibrio sp. INlla14]
MNLVAVAVTDYIGVVILIAMLYSSHIRRSEGRFEYKIFSLIAGLSAFACAIDFMTFYLDGMPGELSRILAIAGNTYCFVTNPLFSIGWCMYTELKLFKSTARIKRRYRFIAIPGLILILISMMNLFVPVVFYLDEMNVYHRLPLSYAYFIVEFGYLIFSYMIFKKYENRYGKVRFFPIGLMMGPVVAGCILQLVFYGISLIWVSLAVGLTAIYMSLQNEFSYLDKLTGLYNRAFLDYILDSYSKDQGARMGGIMIDVDRFKKINDTFGHSVGDEALIDTARVITLSKPDKAVAVRFAGDEFILILKGTSEEALKRVVKNIRDELELFNETEGRQYQLSLSIGYTLFDPEKDNVDSFFRHMDDNMYEEKIRKHSERK